MGGSKRARKLQEAEEAERQWLKQTHTIPQEPERTHPSREHGAPLNQEDEASVSAPANVELAELRFAPDDLIPSQPAEPAEPQQQPIEWVVDEEHSENIEGRRAQVRADRSDRAGPAQTEQLRSTDHQRRLNRRYARFGWVLLAVLLVITAALSIVAGAG